MMDLYNQYRGARIRARESGIKLTPAFRVEQALMRLSRDKWLSPAECLDICVKLAECCSGTPSKTARLVFSGEMQAVGMFMGRAPALISFDRDYSQYLKALRGKKRRNALDLSPEIEILKLVAKKGMTHASP